MTESRKSWWKDNLMTVIVAAMIAAFWGNYEADQARQGSRDTRQDDRIEDLQIITYNLASAWEENRSWQKSMDEKMTKYDEQFMEIWKSGKRGAKIPDMTEYTK